jgi:hypothetical protein
MLQLIHSQDPPRTKAVGCAIFDLIFRIDETNWEDEEAEEDSRHVTETVGGQLLDAKFYEQNQMIMVVQTTSPNSKLLIGEMIIF